MAERLTRWHKIGGVICTDCLNDYSDCFNCPHFNKMREKLAHYEDLEEQGRLHIVPKPFWDKIMEHLIKMECPFEHDLKGFNKDDCKVDDGRCRLCWELALKVGEEE